MELKNWLSTITHETHDPVIFFTGSSYPSLFFSTLIHFRNQHNPGSAIMVDPHMDPALLHAQLQASFLGLTQWYSFRSVEDDSLLDDNSLWRTFLSSYRGPHTILCFSPRIVDPAPHWTIITIPDAIDYQTALQLYALVQSGNSLIPFIDKLFVYSNVIGVDQFLLLLQYGMLAGKNVDQFFMDWLPQLVISQSSFFALSQAFFSKQPRQFLRQWAKLAPLYPAHYWITYWSEQIWRATCYVRLQKQAQEDEAKKIAYRLPFSFINRDWRQFSVPELMAAHEQLYDIDFKVKNGGSETALDYFVMAFVHNRYKSVQKI